MWPKKLKYKVDKSVQSLNSKWFLTTEINSFEVKITLV